MSLSAVLTDALNFFRSQGKALFVMSFPLLLVQNGLQMWLNTRLPMDVEDATEIQLTGMDYGAILLVMLVLFHMYACVTLFLHTRSQGHQYSAQQIWLLGFKFVPSLMLAGVITAVAVMLAMMPALLTGFLPLLVIALWMGVRLAYVNFLVVVEHATPLKAVTECFRFSQGLFLPTIAVLALLFPISFITAVLVQLVAAAPMVLAVFMNAIGAFLALFVTVALFRLYMVKRTPAEVSVES
ncbi:hypothetical protein [Paraferrimonas sedimenticola]|uniref:Membrane protein n=1 Tax=Paraferrimonas sedimenticola TaxID=375674 RepID=A0AA37W2M5_9GAMM|nr:hypothetical protein [Paraferrimonas sedimenticola]GLP97828.1 membrane protein [Paraferrimonas sedimenticola]